MVSSALAQEAVNEVLSRIKEGYAEKSDAKEHIERMEMAHIKLEAALETSHKWNISSAPLLRWQSKLKGATQECDRTLRRCRQRLQEEEEVKQGLQSSSFPKRVVHTAMSFVSSMFSSGNDEELRGSTAVWRFERFADGASEFLRYIELGGTPCRYMFSVPLIRHLLAGKGANLRLSESIDIVGVAIRCLQRFIPYLNSTAEIVKTKLTQDRPHCQLATTGRGQLSMVKAKKATRETFHIDLKLGAHFWPHASSEDLPPAVGGSALEIINDEAKQHGMYPNISFEQLGEITRPKAVDCLRRNVAATLYQMLWKSKHGSAYFRVEKTSCRATTRIDKVGKCRKQRRDKKVPVQGWTSGNNEFIVSWIAHAPAQLQGSVIDYWIQKEKQSAPPLLLKTNGCTRDCPIMLSSLQDHRYLARKLKLSSTFHP
ncbi:unnamed protein product [Miscanthus lutarioriparius]|uniref:Uncharacterized protein n=1 Tax=Miscanthus lutarioriparius TaxID=422564 RepID=A0A811SNH5_9POAL|nr:unnamed protein product [Miscanthus lutarioriparius]